MSDLKDKDQIAPYPFFTVVIATYNRAVFLDRALNSLIHQSEKDWEAIIIDDGSSDNSQIIIAPFLKQYRNITLIKQTNQGSVRAKNAGIYLSSGEYITFLDSDDEYHPDHLAIRKTILTENPDIDLLHGGLQIFGSSYVPDRFNHKEMIHIDNCAVGGTFFIKKALALRLKGFADMYYGYDADFLERVERLGLNIVKTDKPTYFYHREAQDSITYKLSSKVDLKDI